MKNYLAFLFIAMTFISVQGQIRLGPSLGLQYTELEFETADVSGSGNLSIGAYGSYGFNWGDKIKVSLNYNPSREFEVTNDGATYSFPGNSSLSIPVVYGLKIGPRNLYLNAGLTVFMVFWDSEEFDSDDFANSLDLDYDFYDKTNNGGEFQLNIGIEYLIGNLGLALEYERLFEEWELFYFSNGPEEYGFLFNKYDIRLGVSYNIFGR